MLSIPRKTIVIYIDTINIHGYTGKLNFSYIVKNRIHKLC